MDWLKLKISTRSPFLCRKIHGKSMVSCRFSRETIRDERRQAVNIMVQESRKGRAAGRVPVPRRRTFQNGGCGWKMVRSYEMTTDCHMTGGIFMNFWPDLGILRVSGFYLVLTQNEISSFHRGKHSANCSYNFWASYVQTNSNCEKNGRKLPGVKLGVTGGGRMACHKGVLSQQKNNIYICIDNYR